MFARSSNFVMRLPYVLADASSFFAALSLRRSSPSRARACLAALVSLPFSLPFWNFSSLACWSRGTFASAACPADSGGPGNSA